MGAKYSIGQVMSLPHHSHPLPIAEVVTCYRFVKDIGALWREEELTPYVNPLGVGDRVRSSSFSGVYCIKAIHNESAWIWSDDGKYVTRPLYDLERSPTEAGQ